jgi:hypothetical protein
LASGLYGLLDELWGLGAIRALMVLTGLALGALTWALTARAPSALVRFGLSAAVLAIGSTGWTHRPLLLGLVALGLVLLAAEDRLRPAFLVPIGWLWVNVHGSWPLGVVALACLWAGARLDGGDGAVERRALTWFGGGVVLGAINPYGPAQLLFPVRLLSRRESLDGIVEWQAVDFSRLTDWIFLAFLLVGVLALCRRPSWRLALPLVVFGAAAITGVRNIPVAALVLLPGMAGALDDLGGLRADARSPLARPLLLAGLLVGVLALVSVGRTDHLDDAAYPVAADAWLRENDLDPASHRIIARELVGNWFEFRDGATGNVFMDDRVEVLPVEVVADHRTLLRGLPGWDRVLDEHAADAVLWQVDSPLAELLELSPDWSIVYADDDWFVAVPAG